MQFTALAVHSQPEALGEMVELLAGPDLRVDTARSATEAMHKISSGAYSVILVGHRPPILDGITLLEKSIASHPDALRILLVADPNDAIELDFRPRHSGTIIRFVARGSERSRLVGLVAEGLKMLRLVEEQRQLVAKLGREHDRMARREKLLETVVAERTKELEDSYLKLKAAHRQAMFGLAEAIEAKDPYTKGHCGRVAAFCLVLAQESGYPAEGLETLEFGAFLHDIGKIGIRDSVLLKPGPLDEDEWLHMREHPVKGCEIANQIEALRPIMPAVRNHHERWDGKGYPDGLSGDRIPLAARLVAIADAYDAMATDRPYKRALGLAQCEALLRKNAGSMYDPELIEVFCSRHVGAIYRADYDAEPVPMAEPAPAEAEAGGDGEQPTNPRQHLPRPGTYAELVGK